MSSSKQRVLFFVSLILITLAIIESKASDTCPMVFHRLQNEYFKNPFVYENEDGLIRERAPLNVQSLYEGYYKGLFPWLDLGDQAGWFFPPKRGVLFLKDFKLNRSHKKQINKTNFEVTYDKDFEQVIRMASKIHKKTHHASWITPKFIDAYIKFHRAGFAHSIEVWDGPQLVGGLYGVILQGVYYGESMFHTKPNASKVALIHLKEYLEKLNITWIDSQELSPLIKSVGGKEITREAYTELLNQTHKKFSEDYPSTRWLEVTLSNSF